MAKKACYNIGSVDRNKFGFLDALTILRRACRADAGSPRPTRSEANMNDPRTPMVEAKVRPSHGGTSHPMPQNSEMGTVVLAPPGPEAATFDAIYRDAAGDATRIPWAHGRANPMMVSWLNAEAPGLVRPGSRAIVVGCGLGDDVAELISRGYDAAGFDISPTAIGWARERFPDLASQFSIADLFSLPGKFRHRFDLVIEVYTLQALDPARREQAAAAVASLAGPQGHVLAICRGRDDSHLLENVQGPPWPLCPSELLGLMETSGLRPLRPVDDFMDDEPTPQRRLRGVFVRA